jgi:hypothetical protein
MVTIAVIQHWMAYPSCFLTNIVATCTGSLPDATSRREFWHSVAFYDFIQEFAGDGPRIRPHHSRWPRSTPAFAEVLLLLKPELILVLGNQNWDNMGGLDGRDGPPLRSGLGRYSQTWVYPTGDGNSALAFHVKHPSAGYNFRKFSPAFIEAKKLASTGAMLR